MFSCEYFKIFKNIFLQNTSTGCFYSKYEKYITWLPNVENDDKYYNKLGTHFSQQSHW